MEINPEVGEIIINIITLLRTENLLYVFVVSDAEQGGCLTLAHRVYRDRLVTVTCNYQVSYSS